MIKCVTYIFENSLSNFKINYGRIAHKLTKLMHTKSKVWACESQILKSPNHASIFSRVRKGNTIMRKQTCGKAARSLGGLGILHVKTMEHIKSILRLCKGKPKMSSRNLYTQTIIEITKVLKLKRRTESSNKRGNMLGVVHCENNVIYIEKKINDSTLGLKDEQGIVSK